METLTELEEVKEPDRSVVHFSLNDTPYGVMPLCGASPLEPGSDNVDEVTCRDCLCHMLEFTSYLDGRPLDFAADVAVAVKEIVEAAVMS